VHSQWDRIHDSTAIWRRVVYEHDFFYTSMRPLQVHLDSRRLVHVWASNDSRAACTIDKEVNQVDLPQRFLNDIGVVMGA